MSKHPSYKLKANDVNLLCDILMKNIFSGPKEVLRLFYVHKFLELNGAHITLPLPTRKASKGI